MLEVDLNIYRKDNRDNCSKTILNYDLVEQHYLWLQLKYCTSFGDLIQKSLFIINDSKEQIVVNHIVGRRHGSLKILFALLKKETGFLNFKKNMLMINMLK